MTTYQSYQTLIKPTWAPPAYLFGPVWTFLYILIAISFGAVFMRAFKGTIPFAVALPFILNILFNILFTPLQFYFKNLTLASIDVVLVVITLVWAMVAIYPFASWITYMQIPYLLWTSFASVLQLTITWMNR